VKHREWRERADQLFADIQRVLTSLADDEPVPLRDRQRWAEEITALAVSAVDHAS